MQSNDNLTGRANRGRHPLIDTIIARYRLKNDAEFCRVLGLCQSSISKIRNGLQTPGGAMLLRIHEVLGMSFAEMRTLSDSPILHWRRRPAVAGRGAWALALLAGPADGAHARRRPGERASGQVHRARVRTSK